MIFLVVLAALVSCASAQFPTLCECALFNPGQFDPEIGVGNAIPLSYKANATMAEEDECLRPPPDEGINRCMMYCQQYYDNAGGNEVDICEDTSESSTRCLGSVWCENLHNHGLSNVDRGEVNLYYRMVNCEGTVHQQWNYAQREISDGGLCCDNGVFFHCDNECDGCLELNLCECGMFIDEQFSEVSPVEGSPIPLTNVGAEFGPPTEVFCGNWPSQNWAHPCDNYCRISGDFFRASVEMSDPHPDLESMTYGQYYCAAIRLRWGQDYPDEGIGPTTLNAYARMAGCPDPEDPGDISHLMWELRRPYVCHHQQLCCDEQGLFFNCPTERPEHPDD